jgi:hypothetical protein
MGVHSVGVHEAGAYGMAVCNMDMRSMGVLCVVGDGAEVSGVGVKET